MTISTYTKINRMPFSYRDIPAPPPSTEPVCVAGDVVVVDGPWVSPQTATVLDVSDDHAMIWVDVPGPGGDRTAVGVHRVKSIVRGSDSWVRS